MYKICVVHTSVSNLAEAEVLANGLVQQRLCACVQLVGSGRSVYRWQGKLEQAEECYLSIKTTPACQGKLTAWLQDHHPYDLPEITWFTQNSTERYATWVHASVV